MSSWFMLSSACDAPKSSPGSQRTTEPTSASKKSAGGRRQRARERVRSRRSCARIRPRSRPASAAPCSRAASCRRRRTASRSACRAARTCSRARSSGRAASAPRGPANRDMRRAAAASTDTSPRADRDTPPRPRRRLSERRRVTVRYASEIDDLARLRKHAVLAGRRRVPELRPPPADGIRTANVSSPRSSRSATRSSGSRTACTAQARPCSRTRSPLRSPRCAVWTVPAGAPSTYRSRGQNGIATSCAGSSDVVHRTMRGRPPET